MLLFVLELAAMPDLKKYPSRIRSAGRATTVPTSLEAAAFCKVQKMLTGKRTLVTSKTTSTWPWVSPRNGGLVSSEVRAVRETMSMNHEKLD